MGMRKSTVLDRRCRFLDRRAAGWVDIVVEHAIHPIEGKALQQGVEFPLGRFQIVIVLEALTPSPALQPRLVGIELPRVDVEHKGKAQPLVGVRQHPTCEPERQKAEIPSTGDRNIDRIRDAVYGQGKLPKLGVVQFDCVRLAGCRGDPVIAAADREDTRIVGKALIRQNLQGPLRAADNGK